MCDSKKSTNRYSGCFVHSLLKLFKNIYYFHSLFILKNYIILDKTAIPGAFIPLKTEEMHEYVPFPSSYVYPISFKVHHKICMFSYFKANLCVTQILRVTPGQGQG